MKEKIKSNLNIIIFTIVVFIISLIMIFYMSQKEGFHEDEMFTYGSSNCTYDNLFQAHGKQDTTNKIVYNYIWVEGDLGKTIENAIYYLTHQDEYDKLFAEISSTEHPVWKTKEEAKDYLTVAENERFSYGNVYYNQARDIHPPLYCLLNHTVCSFFPDTFSKYFFFSISLVFFIATCFMIRNIMKLLGKDNLSILTVILFGLSMGGISTVIYARMYMLLAFFITYYLYLTLKIYKNDFKMDRRTKIEMVIATVLGFLSQYYFCIFALGCFAVMSIYMLKNKKKKELISYILNHVLSAIIGLIIYPIAIYHIFFSYRGVGGATALQGSYLANLWSFIQLLFKAYSMPIIVGIIALIGLIAWFIYKMIKNKNKGYLLLILVPILLTVLVVAKISPFKELRYLYGILPVLSVGIMLGLSSFLTKIIKNKKIVIVILSVIVAMVSIYGLITKEPEHMYRGYSNHIEIANQYSHDPFVYIGQGWFNHIQSMPEFMIYDKSLILQDTQLEYLKDNEELENTNEFILCIKSYIGEREEKMNQVLEYTGYTNYEQLYEDYGETDCVIFKLTK